MGVGQCWWVSGPFGLSKNGKAYLKAFPGLIFCNNQLSILCIGNACTVPAICFGILEWVHGGDNSVQQFVGLLELFYTYEYLSPIVRKSVSPL